MLTTITALALAIDVRTCSYNPESLNVRSNPKAGFKIAQVSSADDGARSYSGAIDGAPFKLSADICTAFNVEAVVTVPKGKQAQSIQLIGHLLDRLGVVVGGVRLTPAEQKQLKSSGEVTVNRGVMHRIYHYKVEPGGAVTIVANFIE
ncbi:MAG TPA: hypothetical protein VFN88_12965 [Caulobacteraceae bacterium]|nr:hypothetical protein [Caulobacteraceae bacterium]